LIVRTNLQSTYVYRSIEREEDLELAGMLGPLVGSWGLMGMRDKKRNQRRVLSRHSDGPKTGEEKDFPVACFPLNQIKEPENMAHTPRLLRKSDAKGSRVRLRTLR
jgi:hypothetical protein